MLLFPPNFDELLLCVSLHLALEGSEGGGGQCVSAHLRGSQNCKSRRDGRCPRTQEISHEDGEAQDTLLLVLRP